MAFTATIGRGFAWRMIIIGGVCVVLGAWGVYDYAVDIPRRQEANEKREILELCRDALETPQAAGEVTPQSRAALDAVKVEVDGIIAEHFEELFAAQTDMTMEQLNEELGRLGQELEGSPEGAWMALLVSIGRAVSTERRLPLTAEAYPIAFQAYEATKREMQTIGEVTAPGKYDRATQWAFMLCLPSAPYFFWIYVVARRRIYRLDDDGTLHMPEGAWKAEEIADIDMGRWMAKSIAWVVHRDGTRVKFDDYKYRNLHLIIGAIASRLHPDDWDAEAKLVKREQEPQEAAEGASASAEAASASAEAAAK